MRRPEFDIFLHYPGGSPEDGANALRLAELLEQFSLRVWITERDRPQATAGGSNDTALAVLGSVPIFIACVGVRPTGSWGRQEIERAFARTQHDSSFVVCTALLPGAEEEAIPTSLANLPRFDVRGGVTTVAPLMPLVWGRLMPEHAVLLAEIVDACRRARIVALTGPRGSDKTSMAQVAAWVLRNDFPDGTASLSFDGKRGTDGLAGLILRILRAGGPLPKAGARLEAYRERLSKGRYLVVLDDADDPMVDDLVPPAPSGMLVVSRVPPDLLQPHHVFEIPPLPIAEDRPAARVEPTGVLRPGFTSDSPHGDDLLEIGQPVQALCSVIAAKDVEPPLSIGLFGEWGAGKTFFIEKMRARIEQLTAASAAAESSAYCSSVRQIQFNAWHYADANLWASLASRVFEGLAQSGDGAGRELIAGLESSRLQMRNATTEVTQASGRRERAEAEIAAVRSRSEEVAVELRDLAESAPDVLREHGKAKEAELLSFAGSAAELWRRSRKLALGASALIVICALLALLAPGAYAWIAASATAVAATVAVLGWPLRWVLRAREGARRRADELRHHREAELEAELEALREEERHAIKLRAAAREKLEEAEREIEEIRDGRRLYRFIEEQSRPDAYGQYLGLVSLVRRDFERLAELIAAHDGAGADGHPPLERIVLYIDDLDRCPAERVVEVLEAVNLLLASPLFVVVVAVDPRWLLSSLQQRYSRELNAEGRGRWVPTPEDYLEKIFQVPFTLPRMEAAGFERLIGSLMPLAGPDWPAVTSPAAPARSGAGPAELPPGTDDPVEAVPTPPAGPGRPGPAPTALDLEPAGLLISSVEVEFLGGLGYLVRTPRAAKRVTNVYRLIRASLSQEELDELLGHHGRPPEFPCLLLLLAVAVGYPALAPSLMRRLTVSSSNSWWALLSSWAEKDPGSGRKELAQALGLARGADLPDERQLFAKWVPQVARYSYDALPPLSPVSSPG